MKREELWTPSARRFECLLKAAQNGDYNAYMSLMARFFKVMDDKARNNYLRDYEMFTALVERVSEGIFGFSSEDAYQRFSADVMYSYGFKQIGRASCRERV